MVFFVILHVQFCQILYNLSRLSVSLIQNDCTFLPEWAVQNHQIGWTILPLSCTISLESMLIFNRMAVYIGRSCCTFLSEFVHFHQKLYNFTRIYDYFFRRACTMVKNRCSKSPELKFIFTRIVVQTKPEQLLKIAGKAVKSDQKCCTKSPESL